MNIDFNKISDTYGDSVIELVRDNIEDVNENINYMIKLGFTDIEDIFERYTLIFIDTPSTFKYKLNKLINELGSNYIDIIENDLFILEKLMY